VTRRPWLVLAALFAALALVATIWILIDRRPPESDHANHLERALKCHRNLAEGGPGWFRAIIGESSFYPPLAPCAAGVLYFVAPVAPLTAQVVMFASLALGMAAVFALGRRWLGAEGGLLAAFFLATAPFVVFSLNNFQLDLPLAAMVALALWTLVRAGGFAHRGWCLALGAVLGLGLLTKPTFPAYVLPPMLVPLAAAWRAPDRRRRLASLALVLVIAAALALPWYGPRLAGLPMQVANRSFKQAAEAGQVEAYTVAGLSFYPRVFQPQFGVLAGLLCAWGLWAVRRRPDARAFLWLAALVPFAMFSLIQNKNLRYTLPILPAAALLAASGVLALPRPWKRAAIWTSVAVAALQVSMTNFAVPPVPRLDLFLTPLVVSFPPSRADWQEDRVLGDLVRATGGRPATVAIIPNYNFFSMSNFHYAALRHRLPLEVTRAFTGPPIGIDFVVLKTGSQGPSFTTSKADRATRAFATDPYLAAVYPVIAEYTLPDRSRASLRARRIEPVEDVAPADLARRLQDISPSALADYARDAEGLRIRLDYRPEAILRGEIDRVTVEVDAVTIGELARRDRAPLRVRETRVVVDDLLINPRRFVETGAVEVLDAGAVRLERVVITQEDVDALLRGQPIGKQLRVDLRGGAADVVSDPFRSSAKVTAVTGAGDAPFAIRVRDLRIAGVPIAGVLVDWVVRNFDPSLRLKNLPVPVSVAPIRIEPGRLVIGHAS
jgi:hypothetical protein